MVKSEVITSIKMFADRHLGHSSPSQIGSKLPILGQCDNAALPLVAPPRIADRRPFLATRPGFRSHYDIRLTAFYLSPKRCRHRRHRPRRRSTGDCMLSSLALRTFIFHPNQWLVLKATPAKPAYPPRPPCARKFFSVAGKLFSRPFSLDWTCAKSAGYALYRALPDHSRLKE
jgi:hypothetical protein